MNIVLRNARLLFENYQKYRHALSSAYLIRNRRLKLSSNFFNDTLFSTNYFFSLLIILCTILVFIITKTGSTLLILIFLILLPLLFTIIGFIASIISYFSYESRLGHFGLIFSIISFIFIFLTFYFSSP